MAKERRIVYSNPLLRFQSYEKELSNTLSRVISSDQVILGEEVRRFESSFCQFLNVHHCIGVNSGTDALTLALLGLGIPAGSEIIVPAITAHGTVVSILRANMIPVIVDVESQTYCMDPNEAKAAITPKTKAMIPVHLHGFPSDLESLKDICESGNLHLIEDCAQAHGAKVNGEPVGSFGVAGTFSFYPTKNLGCIGDGGAIVTDNETLFQEVKNLRNYGLNREKNIETTGLNSRLDELQAAFLNVMLPDLTTQNQRRFVYAQKYHESLSSFREWLPPLLEGAVYHQFALRIPKRDRFMELMSERGIELGTHYDHTMGDMSAFSKYCKQIPIAQKASKELVSLPIQPEILDEHLDYVLESTSVCLSML